MNETLKRSLTGVIFVALVVLSLLLHPCAYAIVFLLACTAGCLEMLRIVPGHPGRGISLAGILFADGSYVMVYLYASGILDLRWLLILPAGLPGLILLDRFRHTSPEKNTLSFIPFLVWVTAGFSSMHLLAWPPGNHGAYTSSWILYTFYFLWMNDTLAYVTGRLAGKHPLWPRVSPAKTWEGSLGGAFFTLALALVFSRIDARLSPVEWILFALLVILFGSLGDFLESMLKRRAGVKDSGSMLPGHGGVLDRFDSFLLAMPVVTIFLYLAL
jgi:phosphatidate cytidylyltransferase